MGLTVKDYPFSTRVRVRVILDYIRVFGEKSGRRSDSHSYGHFCQKGAFRGFRVLYKIILSTVRTREVL